MDALWGLVGFIFRFRSEGDHPRLQWPTEAITNAGRLAR